MILHEIIAVTVFALGLACIPAAFAIGLDHGHALRPVARLIAPVEFAKFGLIAGYTDECDPPRWSEVHLFTDAGTP